jgi:cytochrome c-type biogenesis protein CcmE
MNGKVTGHRTTGDARFTIEDDSLTITVKVKGAAPALPIGRSGR